MDLVSLYNLYQTQWIPSRQPNNFESPHAFHYVKTSVVNEFCVASTLSRFYDLLAHLPQLFQAHYLLRNR